MRDALWQITVDGGRRAWQIRALRCEAELTSIVRRRGKNFEERAWNVLTRDTVRNFAIQRADTNCSYWATKVFVNSESSELLRFRDEIRNRNNWKNDSERYPDFGRNCSGMNDASYETVPISLAWPVFAQPGLRHNFGYVYRTNAHGSTNFRCLKNR